MNIYTGDVFVSPLSFHIQKINQKLNLLTADFKLRNRLLVGLMSYYEGLQKEKLIFNNRDIDLIKKRTQIGLYGHEHKVMHIYGKGWPDGISREDSRDGNWVESKNGILETYHFNLSFENTAAPRYTTEKIWDSIANYCLPIYYGEGTEIYNLFPKDSFIDYSEIKSPQSLFFYIQNMSEIEFVERLNKCIHVYNEISGRDIKDKNTERIKTLTILVYKLHEITNTSKNTF
jgi:hypothetical protein